MLSLPFRKVSRSLARLSARRFPAVAATGIALVCVTAAGADEVWRVRGGATMLRFNEASLARSGILVTAPIETITAPVWMPDELSFAIDPASTLTVRVTPGGDVELLAGEVLHRGGVTLAHAAAPAKLYGFAIRFDPKYSGSGLYADTLGEDEPVRIDFGQPLARLDRSEQLLRLGYMDIRITSAWAQAMGHPELTGAVIGEARIEAQVEPVAGTPTGGVRRQRLQGGIIDIQLFNIATLRQLPCNNDCPPDRRAFAFLTTACNIGDTDVDWYAPMDPRHPFIYQGVYRIMDGRLEMIGSAEIKHGFASTNSNGCGDCDDPGTFQLLGPGCLDTYSAGNNSNQFFMSPLDEVNPFTGEWDPCGSHFDGEPVDCERDHGSQGHDYLTHRLVLLNDDLGIPTARYFYQGYYVVAGDVDVFNNHAWREVAFTWDGTQWQTEDLSPRMEGPLIYTWGQMQTTVDSGEGVVVLAVQTSDLGAGLYRYTYALYNQNLDRKVRTLEIPVGEAFVMNAGFHDPDFDPSNDWDVYVDNGTLVFATETYDQNPQANAVTYHHTYTFWFDTAAPPGPTTVRMAMFKPAGLTRQDVLTAETIGPQVPSGAPGDCDGDGDVDITDFSTFATCFTGSGGSPPPGCECADLDGDGDVDISDFSTFASNYTGSQ